MYVRQCTSAALSVLYEYMSILGPYIGGSAVVVIHTGTSRAKLCLPARAPAYQGLA